MHKARRVKKKTNVKGYTNQSFNPRREQFYWKFIYIKFWKKKMKFGKTFFVFFCLYFCFCFKACRKRASRMLFCKLAVSSFSKNYVIEFNWTKF